MINVLWVSPLRADVNKDIGISFRSSPSERTIILIQRYTYVGGWGWFVLRHLLNEQLPEGIYTEIWDTSDDDGSTTYNQWNADQVRVELYYGNTLIEETPIQIFF